MVLLTLHIEPHCAGDDGLASFGTAHLALVGGVVFQANIHNLEMVLAFRREKDKGEKRNITFFKNIKVQERGLWSDASENLVK